MEARPVWAVVTPLRAELVFIVEERRLGEASLSLPFVNR